MRGICVERAQVSFASPPAGAMSVHDFLPFNERLSLRCVSKLWNLSTCHPSLWYVEVFGLRGADKGPKNPCKQCTSVWPTPFLVEYSCCGRI